MRVGEDGMRCRGKGLERGKTGGRKRARGEGRRGRRRGHSLVGKHLCGNHIRVPEPYPREEERLEQEEDAKPEEENRHR